MVGRMLAISRPTIVTRSLGVIAQALDIALGAVVAVLAERLQRAQPKGVPITAVPLDVIDFGSSDGDALALTEAAPRLDRQLIRTPLCPAG